jgi:radial spoke head protein 9
LDDSLEIPQTLPNKPFSELERLSFVVNTVDHQCSLVPVGAYKITPTQEVFPNDGFKGLT